jgi:hypothetical protein
MVFLKKALGDKWNIYISKGTLSAEGMDEVVVIAAHNFSNLRGCYVLG